MTERKRRSFTPEFKADAARLMKTGDRGTALVAKDLDLTEKALRDRVKPDVVDTSTGPQAVLTTAQGEARGRRARPCHRRARGGCARKAEVRPATALRGGA